MGESFEPNSQQRPVKVRTIGLEDDHDAIDRAYWSARTHEEKMALVSSMFAEQWLLKGSDAKLLRLRRDITSLQRRSG